MDPNNMPYFDGEPVDVVELALSGTVDDVPTERHQDDEVVLIVKGKVAKVTGSTTSFGVRKRLHSIKAAFAIEADKKTAKAANEAHKRWQDEVAGQESLDAEIEDAVELPEGE